MGTRDERPLSPVQQGLLLHRGDGGTAYIDQMLCWISGELEVPVVRRTLATLIERHDALRCRFPDGPARQEIVAHAAATSPAFRDIGNAQDPRALVERFAAHDVARGFDLSAETSRCYLFRLARSEHAFLWTYHHAIADSWTLRVLQDEFLEIYAKGAPDPKAPSITRYLDWVAAQDQAESREFWHDYLTGYRSSQDQRPVGLHRAAPAAVMELRLGAEVRADVEAARRACKATTNAVILALWAVCALDLTQRPACLIGCVTAGRGVPVEGIERVAGALANTVPVAVSAETALGDLVRQFRDHAFAASRHSYLSLGDIMACAGLRPADLHSVVNFTLDRKAVKGEEVPFTVPAVHYNDQATFPAYLDVDVEDNDVHVRIRYDPETRFFATGTIRRAFSLVLRSLVENPAGSIRHSLDAMTVEEFGVAEAPLSF